MNLSDFDKQLIWHPFTQHHTSGCSIPITKGDGVLLWGENGEEYIDAISSWWTNVFGHCQPDISQAIKCQLDTLEHVIFSGFTHRPAVDLADLLLSALPENQKKVFFSDNGSTAVEVALKMSIQYWHNKGIEKQTFISFVDAYHGDTFGAMSVGTRGVFNQAFESLLFNVEFVDLPNESNFEMVLNHFIDIIHTGNVAAFIFEPLIQGSAGMNMYSSIYLDKLIEIAKNESVICIADEVMTGIGRTGKPFASDYLTHNPDIFCISKGITGGFLPLGLTTCTQPIYDAFLSTDKMKTFLHGHSYTGNPLSCAAAVASLKLLNNSASQISSLTEWQKLFALGLRTNSKIENVRHLGTIVAFEVITQQQSNYFNELRDFLYTEFLKRGVLLRPLGNTIYIMPPYVISHEQLKYVYAVIDEVLKLV